MITTTDVTLPLGTAPDAEVLAFGDVHGRSDLFAALLDVAATLPRRATVRTVVTLGDLIDRGPDSLGCIALARSARARLGADAEAHLMGNHEQMARIGLDADLPQGMRALAQDAWIANGGGAVVREATAGGGDVEAALRAGLEPWLKGLASHHASGGLTFVHAGLPPHAKGLEEATAAPWAVALDRSFDERTHWCWVREPFLDRDAGPHFGRFVVHGHTMTPHLDPYGIEDQVARHRINLDGGSYRSGRVRMLHVAGTRATLYET